MAGIFGNDRFRSDPKRVRARVVRGLTQSSDLELDKTGFALALFKIAPFALLVGDPRVNRILAKIILPIRA